MLISAAAVCWLVFNHLQTNTSSKIAAKMNTECYTVLGVKHLRYITVINYYEQ